MNYLFDKFLLTSSPSGRPQITVWICLITVLVCSYIAELIGVHSIFGAFMVGVMLPRRDNLPHHMTQKLEELTSTLFLLMFFAGIGLKTDLKQLNNGFVAISILTYHRLSNWKNFRNSAFILYIH